MPLQADGTSDEDGARSGTSNGPQLQPAPLITSVAMIGVGTLIALAGPAERPRPSLALRLSFLRRSIARAQAANLQDLDAKCFEPGQQALEGRLIPDLAMDDGLDGLH
jgi:hypothetical protein